MPGRDLRFQACVLTLAGLLPRCSWAINLSATGNNTTNATNVSNVTQPVCTLPCCTNEIRQEALLACQGYEALGITSNASCLFWQDYAEEACTQTCGDCTQIAKQIYSSCLFLLQPANVMSFSAAVQYCRGTEQTFRDYQCPTACIDNGECFSNPARLCSKVCDNYKKAPALGRDGCVCVQERMVTGMPDSCRGETVLEGPIAGRPGLVNSCVLIPDYCKNHRPGTLCGKYRHCLVDVCSVNGTQCPLLDSCQSAGVCAPANGMCYYSVLADGSSCDDGLFYTHTDRCADGTCIGIVNKCLRDSVNCSTTNPCLRPSMRFEGACYPPTGTCVFENVADGTPCASLVAPGSAPDGQCRAGLCRDGILRHDACQNITCPWLGQCYETSACSRESGCTAVLKVEGTSCNDSNPKTYGDRCIEGRCVGDPVETLNFRPVAVGSCTQQARRYYGDAPDIDDCEAQCRLDPECTFYSYGYQVCSIFGTSRTVDPDPDVWSKQWVLEIISTDIQHNLVCFQKTGEKYLDTLTTPKRSLLVLTLCFVTILPLVFFILVHRQSLCKSCRRLCGGDGSDVLSSGAAPASSRGGGAKVAAAPAVKADVAMSLAMELPRADEPYSNANGELHRVPDPRGEVQPTYPEATAPF